MTLTQKLLASIFVGLIFIPFVSTHAQLPTSQLQRVFPLGGKSGSKVEVEISGGNLDETSELLFSQPKIGSKAKLTPATEFTPAVPVSNRFQVDIPADIEPGIYEIRAFGRFGLSTPRRFVVGLNEELVCNDQNKTRDTAMAVSNNTTVNGKAIANGRHFYKFTLTKGEKVAIECLTRILDSKMDPVLVVSDSSGKEISRARSSTLHNAAIFFKAPIASQYILTVRDAVFSGGPDFFYRLNISSRPYIGSVFPPVISQKSNADLTIHGWNLPGGTENNGIEMVQTKSSQVVHPARNTEEFPLQTSSFAMQWSSLCFKDNNKTISNQVPIFVTSGKVTIENPSQDITNFSAPAEIAGRFSPGNETDIYEFSAKAGEVFFIDAYSHRLGHNTDLILTVQQKIGGDKTKVSWKNLSVTDDPGNRAAGLGPNFSTSTDDPGTRLQVPADGVYRVLIKDQFGTYDSPHHSHYWISLRRPKPDFRVVCLPMFGRAANANQIIANALALRRGGRSHLSFSIEKIDGFSGPVTVTCENLPKGVTCPPVNLSASQANGDLVFYASDDAPTVKSLIKVTGKAKVGDQEISRTAFYSSVTWGTGNKGQIPAFYRRTPDLEISVMPHETAAVTVQAGDGKIIETSLGGKVQLPIKLTRRHNFTEPLKLAARSLPGQIKPKDLTIAKGKNDGNVEIFVKDKNTALGTYTFCFKGDAKFKYSRNPEAAKREEAEHKRLEELLKTTKEEKAKLAPQIAKNPEAKEKLVAIDAKIKKIEAARNAAKSRMDNLKKQSAPKDLFYMAVSNPLEIRVVSSPINIQPVPPQKGTAESMVSPILKIERRYGFSEAINLSFKAPAGTVIKGVTIAKDKSEIPLPIELKKNAPVGDHSIEITATAKFNNVDVKTIGNFTLKINAKPDAAEKAK